MSISPDPTQALAGLRVLEFSHTVMGPCAGLLFADLGADVIKVEPAPGGDKTRSLSGFASGFFATFNRNKRSIAIDLKQPQGQDLIHRLVKTSDVVLDNYGPGTMEKLGCGWEALQSIKPSLVYLSLKGYLNGPWQQRGALDEVVQFQSGLAYMTGPPGQPLRAGASIIDILGAIFGVTGTLSALRERDRSGRGQRVGSALFESAAFLMASHISGGVATGEAVPPMTARKGAWGIYDVFHSRDERPLFIGVTSDAQWQRFCKVFSLAHLLQDQRLTSNVQRTHERDWLLPQVRQSLSQLSHATLIEKCKQADISWSPVGRPEDLLANEQLLAGGGLLATALSTAAASVAPQTLIPALPLEFGEQFSRPSLRRQPPVLGQHTDEILDAVGLDAAAIEKLRARRVII